MPTSQDIDAHFDAMLFDGMPPQAAALVEQMRATAHDQNTQDIIARARTFPVGPVHKFDPDQNPIRRIL